MSVFNLNSCFNGSVFERSTFAAFSTFLSSPFSILKNISPRANSPINAGINSIPSAKSGMPIEKRENGNCVSNPTVINNNPIPEDINPFNGLFPASDEIMVRPNTPRAKYSYDSNERASDANGTEKRMRIIVPTNPPIVEAVNDVISACNGLPCLVSSYPSNVVATAPGVPGVLIAIAVIEPP